jgi:uncharacterized protein (DUF2342 family)
MTSLTRKEINKTYNDKRHHALQSQEQLLTKVLDLEEKVLDLENTVERFRHMTKWSDQDLLDARDYISNR